MRSYLDNGTYGVKEVRIKRLIDKLSAQVLAVFFIKINA